MAQAQRRIGEPDSGNLELWVRDRLGMRPGDSARVPATNGGAVRVLRRGRHGPFESLDVHMPAWVASALGTTQGHTVCLELRGDGSLLLIPLNVRLEDVVGMLTYNGPPVSADEIDDAIADAAAERFQRL